MPPARLDAFVPPPPAGRRGRVLGELADALLTVGRGRRVVVAIDGVDGPDRTVLGHELVGILLHRPELADLWDASVWVDVPFGLSVPRGNARFGAVGAQAADPASAVNTRYVGGQRLYLAGVDPTQRATWVLDNTDLSAPLLTGPGASPGMSRDEERGRAERTAP